MKSSEGIALAKSFLGDPLMSAILSFLWMMLRVFNSFGLLV
jgi:hypothetical protein